MLWGPKYQKSFAYIYLQLSYLPIFVVQNNKKIIKFFNYKNNEKDQICKKKNSKLVRARIERF